MDSVKAPDARRFPSVVRASRSAGKGIDSPEDRFRLNVTHYTSPQRGVRYPSQADARDGDGPRQIS
jgi:hypothetical protein